MKNSNLIHTLSLVAMLLLAMATFQACKKAEKNDKSALNTKDFTSNFESQAQQFQDNGGIL